MRGRLGPAAALYGTVLAGGLYIAAAGLAPATPWRTAAFVAGLLALSAVEWLGRATRWGLVLQVVLIHAVVAMDTSGLARVLFLLVPFAVYRTLGRRAGYAAALAYAVGVVSWTSATGGSSDREAFGDLIMFAVGLVFAVTLAALAVKADADRDRAERLLDELAESNRRIAALAAAEERNRVARDIHDSLGHHLTAIAIQLEKATAYRERDAEVAARAVTDAHGSARAALAEVRRSVATLRADVPSSLSAELAVLAARLGSPGTTVTSTVHGDCPPGLRATLVRVAQEGLTNAVRHAGARSVTVTVHCAADAIALTVRDDGTGLPGDLSDRPGYGLPGMRERLAAVGGTLELTGPPGLGTTLTARVPL
ncbi:Signal transduction histidine kinase [Cryptosporangium aurantiacum]|uniref:Signal transduction histidine kinase n=1 Tax=Cryptosporangium aurantiacum TaxID=134849 RepID=A0A1M7RIL0_9ACTN|nr:Signal transduction histidine kinase [Cryptosporangium aurantiacum]